MLLNIYLFLYKFMLYLDYQQVGARLKDYGMVDDRLLYLCNPTQQIDCVVVWKLMQQTYTQWSIGMSFWFENISAIRENKLHQNFMAKSYFISNIFLVENCLKLILTSESKVQLQEILNAAMGINGNTSGIFVWVERISFNNINDFPIPTNEIREKKLFNSVNRLHFLFVISKELSIALRAQIKLRWIVRFRKKKQMYEQYFNAFTTRHQYSLNRIELVQICFIIPCGSGLEVKFVQNS